MIEVIIAGDDPFACASLETVLNAQIDIEAAASATSGPKAAGLYEQLGPDALLMDIQTPEGDGPAAAEGILAKYAGFRVGTLPKCAGIRPEKEKSPCVMRKKYRKALARDAT